MSRAAVFAFASAAAARATPVTCEWSDGKLEVSWAAPEHESVDYYEVQVAIEAGGSLFAVHSTGKTQAQLDFLTADRSFWLKVRAHKAGMPSLGPGSWSEPGAETECKTGGGSGLATRTGITPTAKTMLLEVLRQSEYTKDVDYLMNHNSGDFMGDTAFVVGTHGGFGDFSTNVFTLYCLEILAVSIPDTVTTDHDDRFADYVSCNNNRNHTDPQCACDAFIDRSFSKAEDQEKYCHNEDGEPCSERDWHCTCDCTDASLAASAKYVGMMPVYFKQPELIGHWYSTPKATECGEFEAVGDVRPDGTTCTWKRHPEARVARGSDALEFGWNDTYPRHVEAAQVHQNAAIFRDVFDAQPFQKWSCGAAPSPATLLI